ncbi:MAG: RsmD family RNA methyltransferase [Bacteroides sp.]|nr:RsmD family RNA methyltransferase [Bacteroides sp.]MCM1379033.1 RsmD family RNA methyltransferase [Bacteroides sp.]MCM1445649.1 RsmD family RNA methyltransferase [Prevotella sp.]
MKQRNDYYAQLLRANGDPQKLNKILQDTCRRKAAKKLAATLSLAPGFRFPTELSAEQCTADVVAEFHASLLPEGCSVVDLTAGLGIDCFHIARRASDLLAIEMDMQVCDALLPNADALALPQIRALCADSTEWLKNTGERFDVAFIDPARRAADGSRLYSLSQCRPNVIELLNDIERIAPRLIIKASPMLDITQTLAELRNVSALYAVGTRSECKELLIDIDFTRSVADPAISAITIDGGAFISTVRRSEPVEDCRNIAVGDTLGEPWPAVMKIQPRGLFPRQLHPSTLLFLNPDADFPGEVYRIERIEEFSSSTVRRLAREKLAASVATRNFPLSADQLRLKLKARECSSERLMATTVAPNRQLLIFLTKQ